MTNYISAEILNDSLGTDEDDDKKLLNKIYQVLPMLSQSEESEICKTIALFKDWYENFVKYDDGDKQDFRFHHVLIKNFRRYGAWDGSHYYGIKFQDSGNNIIPFLFLLGDNGIGKSSMFGALEYWATGDVSEARYRKIENIDWYLSHKDKEPDIRIIGETGTYDLKTQIQVPFDLRSFFISENTIMQSASYMPQFSGEDCNWFLFFCFLIGIHPSLIKFVFNDNFSDKLENWLSEELKESVETIEDEAVKSHARQQMQDYICAGKLVDEEKGQLKELKNKLSQKHETLISSSELDLEKEIDSINNLAKSDLEIDALDALRLACTDLAAILHKETAGKEMTKIKLVEDTENKVDKSKIKERLREALSDCIQRLNRIIEKQIKYEDIIKNHNVITPLVDNNIDIASLKEGTKHLDQSLKKEILGFVKKIVDEQFKTIIEKNLRLAFLTQDENFTFNISNIDNYKIAIDVNGIPVHKYFNTFRYRLFCLSLQVAVNLKLMNTYNISFPMVFDDVFFANDYKNKYQLYRFFEVIQDEGPQILKDKQHLQVLFFTHDEQFISSLQKKGKRISFGRILNPDECKELPFQIKEYKDGDNTKKYYNLYFPIYEKYELIK